MTEDVPDMRDIARHEAGHIAIALAFDWKVIEAVAKSIDQAYVECEPPSLKSKDGPFIWRAINADSSDTLDNQGPFQAERDDAIALLAYCYAGRVAEGYPAIASVKQLKGHSDCHKIVWLRSSCNVSEQMEHHVLRHFNTWCTNRGSTAIESLADALEAQGTLNGEAIRETALPNAKLFKALRDQLLSEVT